MHTEELKESLLKTLNETRSYRLKRLYEKLNWSLNILIELANLKSSVPYASSKLAIDTLYDLLGAFKECEEVPNLDEKAILYDPKTYYRFKYLNNDLKSKYDKEQSIENFIHNDVISPRIEVDEALSIISNYWDEVITLENDLLSKLILMKIISYLMKVNKNEFFVYYSGF